MYKVKLFNQSDIKIRNCFLLPNMKDSWWLNRLFRYYCDLCPTLIFTNFCPINTVRQVSSMNRTDHVPSIKTRPFRPYVQFCYSHQIDSDSKYPYVLSHTGYYSARASLYFRIVLSDRERVRRLGKCTCNINWRRHAAATVWFCYRLHFICSPRHGAEYKFNNKIFHSTRLNGMT